MTYFEKAVNMSFSYVYEMWPAVVTTMFEPNVLQRIIFYFILIIRSSIFGTLLNKYSFLQRWESAVWLTDSRFYQRQGWRQVALFFWTAHFNLCKSPVTGYIPVMKCWAEIYVTLDIRCLNIFLSQLQKNNYFQQWDCVGEEVLQWVS